MNQTFIDQNIVDKKYDTKLLYHVKSKFQDIKVYDSKTGKMLVIDDDLQLNEHDEHIYHEMITHVPLMSLPNAENVMIIGGGDGGTCREVLKHKNVKEIFQIEIDEEVVKTCLEYFPEMGLSLTDSRVKLYYADACMWIKTYKHLIKNKFDVIIMDTTDFNASAPLFTDEFFKDLKSIMNTCGVLVFNGDCLNWNKETIKDVMECQSGVFKFTRVYQAFLPMYGDGHYGFIYSSDLIDPLNHIVTKLSFDKKNIITKYYDVDTHASSFILSRGLKKYLYDCQLPKQLGFHAMIDFSGMSFDLLNNYEKLNIAISSTLIDSGLKIINTSHHIFEPQGVTICYLLTTSHFGVHTWPENGKCCLDLFTCDEKIDINKMIYKLIYLFKPEKYDVKYSDRGTI